VKTIFIAMAGLLAIAATPPSQQLLAPGVYRTGSGHTLYAGVERDPPDAATNETFDAATNRVNAPIAQPVVLVTAIREERRVIHTPQGALGVSLWSTDARKRAAVILIHGNDPETRDMGFLIPYFAANGIDVISYDQRGTGQSTGNWFANGPPQRAVDVEAVFDAFALDPRVDPKRVGVYGFSNGGWTAPIVAARRPLAFMLLKSAPAETLHDNVMYEVAAEMHHDGFGTTAVRDAQHAWQMLIDGLDGRARWSDVAAVYDAAQRQRWFSSSLLPPHLSFPLSATAAEGYRRFITYDPLPILSLVRTPTLALFGALDRNVDERHAAATFASVFPRAGMTDLTVKVYPNAGHTLKVSRTGYNGEVDPPERYVKGYPQIMIDWLRRRGLLE
jgi:alpha-beta hydrolase superfamily lysophospholipase